MSERVELGRRVLVASELVAGELRERFLRDGTLVLNLISSPGSGKTTLLEATVARRAEERRLAVLEGDVATERDAERIRALGVPARQILTGGACHLDARQVRGALEEEGWAGLDLLFIENVGNLICPTTYDLGEDFKVALLSVTEGDDKPFKYPGIFSRADTTVLTKIDLLPHVPFDLEAVREHVAALNPGGTFLTTSALTGEGIDAWCALLEARLAEKRDAAGIPPAPA